MKREKGSLLLEKIETVERYSPILMISGRAAAWAARSASRSHLAAISGSGPLHRLSLRLRRHRHPPRPPPGSLRLLPSAVETHTAGKQDGMASSLKCAAQTFASGPRIYPLARKRGRKKEGGASALCHDDTVTTGVPRIREVDVRANRFDSCRPNGNEGSG